MINPIIKPRTFWESLSTVALIKEQMSDIVDELPRLISTVYKTETNYLNFRSRSFLTGIATLGSDLQRMIDISVPRSVKLFKDFSKSVRSSHRISVAEFMRENFVACPALVANELAEASGENDFPIGDSSAEWKDLNCSVSEISTGEFSSKILSWSWIGSSNT
jgi:hypothetical protein